MLSFAEIEALNQQIQQEGAFLDRLYAEISKVIVGQRDILDRLLIGLLSRGHILLEGMPGLAKTMVIKTLARALDVQFSRIQFTPDLLPADILGTQIYHPARGEFSVRKGPIFAHFVLADEINRAPAKVQSALLEAMQERQVTIGHETFLLEEPFLVLATQNPIEQEGTYPLPEAQVDRFLLKVKIGYPKREEERQIIRLNLNHELPPIQPVVPRSALLKAREALPLIYVDEKIEDYILDIVSATRAPAEYGLKSLSPLIAYGASPRASIALAQSARALAFLRKRGYVTPEDVRSISYDVLRHRIGLTYEAEAENVQQEHIIQRILAAIEVP
ncbi:MAG: MoxR family ATPase [Saprospiraceae bacterium]|nr:MoxR family ATPase [Saprospiraceae bacterium]MDW8482722.1 MoxR family ATPase [Saprospiraceae bacterium]